MSLVKERQKLSANFNLLKREILFLDLREKTEIEILIKKEKQKRKTRPAPISRMRDAKKWIDLTLIN